MIPSRKLYQGSDETNLKQSMSKPILNPNPLPPHISSDDESNPPPVPRRQPNTSLYQPSLSSTFGYGMNPYYGMNSNFNLMSGYTNPMIPGSVLPTDSMFNGVESISRSAFESVGSVVQTFSSCSMMLQSTLFAIQNSVNAINQVAQQLTNVRSYFAESFISIIQIIKYYFRRISRLLQLFMSRRVVRTSHDDTSHPSIPPLSRDEHGNRHILLFFAVVIGTPYLIWRLMKSVISHSEQINNWQKGIGEHFSAEVKFTYIAVNTDELSVNQGDVIHIAPKHRQPQVKGWILAAKEEKHGLVPANYIKILSKHNNDASGGVNSHKIQELVEEKEDMKKDLAD